MKIIIYMFLCFFSSLAWGVDASMQNQMLDSQIDKLTRERDEKRAALNDCKKQLKKHKIAGASTLMATGVGLYANIKLTEKIQKLDFADSSPGTPTDNRSQEQKDCNSCALFIQAGLTPLPDECTGCA